MVNKLETSFDENDQPGPDQTSNPDQDITVAVFDQLATAQTDGSVPVSNEASLENLDKLNIVSKKQKKKRKIKTRKQSQFNSAMASPKGSPDNQKMILVKESNSKPVIAAGDDKQVNEALDVEIQAKDVKQDSMERENASETRDDATLTAALRDASPETDEVKPSSAQIEQTMPRASKQSAEPSH